MHGIISIAALHFAYLNPHQRSRYELISATHQNIALPSYRVAASHITSENCDCVFAFSLLLIMSHFASSSPPNVSLFHPETAATNWPAQWIFWQRGCHAILKRARPYILKGPLGTLASGETMIMCALERDYNLPGDENDQSLERLLQHINHSLSFKAFATAKDAETYVDAINKLRRLLAASCRSEDSLSCRTFASVWPAIIPDAFVGLLNELQPPALAIMAHYCLLLKNCQSCWYMARSAQELLRNVGENLAREWTVYIQRPLSVVGTDPKHD
jgi:hypothetical protein